MVLSAVLVLIGGAVCQWITHSLPIEFSSTLLQTGEPFPPASSLFPSFGLDGTGETIGLVDTALDPDHCALSGRATGTGTPFNVSRAHGTAVAAMAVGMATQSTTTTTTSTSTSTTTTTTTTVSSFAAMATGASLVMIEMGSPVSSEAVLIGPDVRAEALAPLYSRGARVMSMSWGCDTAARGLAACRGYGDPALSVDSFLYDTEDALVVFSAGNVAKSATTESSAAQALGEPANAKNALTVGACLGANIALGASLSYVDMAVSRAEAGIALCAAKAASLVASGCCAVNPAGCLKTEQDCCAQGPALECCPARLRQLYSDNPKDWSQASLASFSSYGPTLDGRRKPDVVAPGIGVVTAQAGSGCGFTAVQGTSVSAPAVAGAAALIRQYFVRGYAPLGVKGSGPSVAPTGALVKALIVLGAAPLTGSRARGDVAVPLPPLPATVPSDLFGFGRVWLGAALPLGLKDGSVPWLAVADRQRVGAAGQVVTMCLRLDPTAGRSLAAALVWMDPPLRPAQPNSTASLLVHDLDLSVEVVSLSYSYTLAWGNGGQGPDRLNNVERAVLPRPGTGFSGFAIINVTASRVGPAGQSYALAVSGPLGSASEPCGPALAALAEVKARQGAAQRKKVALVAGVTAATLLSAAATLAAVVYLLMARKRSSSSRITAQQPPSSPAPTPLAFDRQPQLEVQSIVSTPASTPTASPALGLRLPPLNRSVSAVKSTGSLLIPIGQGQGPPSLRRSPSPLPPVSPR